MNLFYAPDLKSSQEQVPLSGPEAHHIQRVFRKRSGEQIRLTNGKGLLATCTIQSADRGSVTCLVDQLETIAPLAEQSIVVGLALIRPNRMDWAIEKLTELGIGCIQPITFQHSSVRQFKHQHLQNIAVAAMKQSGQAYMPKISPLLDFKEWLSTSKREKNHLLLVAHPGASAVSLSELPADSSNGATILIGPEGGFSEEEVAASKSENFQQISLGQHILRAETAAIVAVSQLKMRLGL